MKVVSLGAICAAVTFWGLATTALAPRARPAEVAGVSAPGTDELPGALERFYPPVAREPIYLQRMLGLSSALSGIAADLLEGDLEEARRGFERLEHEYVEVASLVADWEPRFPMRPLEALETALAEAEVDRCMQAIDELGAACHRCHLETMVPVQQAYRWKRFGEIVCVDRATGERLSYVKLMRDLDLGLSGVAADVAQEQPDRARAYLRLFRDRFDQLERTCLFCHAGKRAYYVDEEVRGQVDEIGAALDQEPVDPGRVMKLVQDIGTKSCGRCHLVHMPAAVAQSGVAH